MMIQQIMKTDVSILERQGMDGNGTIKLLPTSFWNEFPSDTLNYFMWKHALYSIPTEESVELVKGLLVGPAVEIGAGNGSWGLHLGIPATDSMLQRDNPVVRFYYELMGQPLVSYPPHVRQLEAEEAVQRYKPCTVFGSYITHKFVQGRTKDGNMWGVREEAVLKRVRRYVMLGNLSAHGSKPLLALDHQEISSPFLVTRGDRSLARIFVWKGLAR